MGHESERDLTRLLADVNTGRDGASDILAAAVQAELRAMAERRLVREFGRNLPGVTIQPTLLADDTFMRLIKQRKKYDSSGHFFAIASLAMQRVLLDYLRIKRKRPVFLTLTPDVSKPAERRDVDVGAFYEAVRELARLDARKADVVQYRVIWGLTVAEIAEALNVGRATVERDWVFAKAWLSKKLGGTEA